MLNHPQSSPLMHIQIYVCMYGYISYMQELKLIQPVIISSSGVHRCHLRSVPMSFYSAVVFRLELEFLHISR
jgi:hypothetical protein